MNWGQGVIAPQYGFMYLEGSPCLKLIEGFFVSLHFASKGFMMMQ